MKSLVPKLWHMSLRAILVTVVILQVVLLAMTYMYAMVSEHYKTRQQNENRQYQAGTALLSVVENHIRTLETVSTYPMQRDALNQNTELFRAWAQSEDVLTDWNARRLFRETLYEEYPLFPDVEMIALYDTQGSGIYNTRHGAATSMYETACRLERDTAPWFQAAMEARGAAVLIPANEFLHSGILTRNNLLCVARAMMDVSTRDYHSIGVIVVGIAADDIDKYFASVRAFPESRYTVLLDGRAVAGNAELSESDMDCLTAEIPLKSGSGSVRYGGNMYSFYSDNGYTAVIQTDIAAWNGAAYHFDPLFYVLLVFLTLVNITIILFILRGIIFPTRLLVRLCREFQGEPLDIPNSTLMPKELDSLFVEFKKMSERLTKLIHEVLIRDLRQKDSELKLLRTQINPHFIYNTLQIVQSKAYIHKTYDIASMAELLAENLRYGLREPNREVELSAEVDSVRKYLELMGYHYGERMEYHLHFSKEILSFPVIKLLLQPIVENSLVHGLNQSVNRIAIDISGFRDGSDIVLCVTDNGCGIRGEVLESITKALNDNRDSGTVGIRNVHQRIRLSYGDAYGLDMQSVWGKGTRSVIRVPIREEKEVEASDKDTHGGR